jgi:hypothetical protein
MLMPGQLAVPWCPDPQIASRIGRALRQAAPPRLIVGPRVACDNLLEGWNPRAKTLCRHDQRLYTCSAGAAQPHPGLRPAHLNEWVEVARNAADMEHEDVGVDPSMRDPDAHRKSVKERLRQRRTWVIERQGEIVFQINVGMRTPWGAQLGGTFVPKAHRGTGLAVPGTAAVTQRLLSQHRQVSLHVSEANTPAVRTYERVGFQSGAAFRLITLEPT